MAGKAVVMGMLQRDGQATATKALPDNTKETLSPSAK